MEGKEREEANLWEVCMEEKCKDGEWKEVEKKEEG